MVENTKEAKAKGIGQAVPGIGGMAAVHLGHEPLEPDADKENKMQQKGPGKAKMSIAQKWTLENPKGQTEHNRWGQQIIKVSVKHGNGPTQLD